MFDIDIVRAGKRGLRPGVVAIEYVDWLLALLSAWSFPCRMACIRFVPT
jgi:hypothetical protein